MARVVARAVARVAARVFPTFIGVFGVGGMRAMVKFRVTYITGPSGMLKGLYCQLFPLFAIFSFCMFSPTKNYRHAKLSIIITVSGPK